MIWNRRDDDAHRLVDSFIKKMLKVVPEEKREAFGHLMKEELDANFGKGDRDAWLQMSTDEALNEIRYHLEKLETAVEMGEKDQVIENAVDVANCAMIFLDVQGWIQPEPMEEPPSRANNLSHHYHSQVSDSWSS
jgi:hypothetical protein